MMIGQTAPSGRLRMEVVPAPRPVLTLDVARQFGLAQPGQPAHVKAWKRDNEQHFERTLRDLEAVERGRGPAFLGAVWAKHHHDDGTVTDLGLISGRVVTTVGVGFIVDAFQNLTELENMKYHGLGTGVTAEASSDTTLATELTTQYTTSSTRPTGTLTENTATVFETIATISVKSAAAITEHGIFSQASAPGGVLLDRSVFAVVNLATNEALTVTYDLSLPAGG
jgi:hypothetical protein